MIGYTYRIACGLNDVINIILMGDFHEGNVACREDKIASMVDWIYKKKNCYWIDMGDKIEAINISDKRWDGSNCPEWIQTADLDDLAAIQAERYMNLVKKIKHKCIGMIEGNHEFKLRKEYKTDIHKSICSKLKVANLGYSALIRLMFSRAQQKAGVTLYVEHGSGAPKKAGAKINKIEEKMGHYAADIYAMGHCHDKVSHTSRVISLNHRGELVEKKRISIATSSFFDTIVSGVTTYGERADYPPACVGATRLYIKPFNVQREEVRGYGSKWLKTLPPDIHIGE